MKLKSFLPNILIFSGVILIFYSIFLFVNNEKTETHAKDYSENILNYFENSVFSSIEVRPTTSVDIETLEKLELDDNLYIGILTIPSLNLELPIQSDWSYDKLKNTPCVFDYKPFSIAGHNYTSHFKYLTKLNLHDTVIFTNIYGYQYFYEVVLIETVNQSNIEALQNENFDLTLFTCNYSNDSLRLLVRLNYL